MLRPADGKDVADPAHAADSGIRSDPEGTKVAVDSFRLISRGATRQTGRSVLHSAQVHDVGEPASRTRNASHADIGRVGRYLQQDTIDGSGSPKYHRRAANRDQSG